MINYVALLRGINVGGHNKIKMADLREALIPLGLQNIRTYIQSGNILFQSTESEEVLQKQIHETIQINFDITSTVIIRTAEEFQHIVNNCPFSPQDIAEASATAMGKAYMLPYYLLPLQKKIVISTYHMKMIKSVVSSLAERSIFYFTIASATPNLANNCPSSKCPQRFVIGKLS